MFKKRFDAIREFWNFHRHDSLTRFVSNVVDAIVLRWIVTYFILFILIITVMYRAPFRGQYDKLTFENGHHVVVVEPYGFDQYTEEWSYTFLCPSSTDPIKWGHYAFECNNKSYADDNDRATCLGGMLNAGCIIRE